MAEPAAPPDLLVLLRRGDLHDLAAAADAARERVVSEGATYRVGDGDDPGVHVVTVEPGEDAEARLRRLREAAARPDLVALTVAWAGGAGRATGLEVVRTLAAARLLLPEGVHLVAPWRDLGSKLAQVSLGYGADDLGTVGPGEEALLRRWVEEAGRVPRRREEGFRMVEDRAQLQGGAEGRCQRGAEDPHHRGAESLQDRGAAR